MPERDLVFGLRLQADGKGFVGQVRVARGELDKLAGGERRAGAEAKRFTRSQREAAAASGKLGSSAGGAVAGTRSLGGAIKTASAALKGFVALQAVQLAGRWGRRLAAGSVRYADANTELRNRLRLTADSEEDLETARRKLLRVSRETRTELSTNATLYSRLALASEHLGRSDEELVRVVELLNKQLRIGGSSGREAQAGLIQFAQGIASGRLQGDELRSVMENLLGVQQGLLTGFRKLRQEGQIDFDVTRANIRDLASEGVLTSDLLIAAVLKSGEETDRAFREVNVGIGESLRALRVEAGNFFDHLERRTGLFASFAEDVVALQHLIAGPSEDDSADELLADYERFGGLINKARAEAALLNRELDKVAARRLEPGQLFSARESEIQALSDDELDDIRGGILEGYGEVDESLAALFSRRSEFLLYRQQVVDNQAADLALLNAEQARRARDPVAAPPPDLEAKRRDARAEVANELNAAREASGPSAKRLLALEREAMSEADRIEAVYDGRIALIDRYGQALDGGSASLERFAEEERASSLAALETARALADHDRLYGALASTMHGTRGSLGELTESYGRQRRAILSNTEATREEKVEAIAALQEKHRAAVAARDLAAAEEFEAAKRRATAKAWEMLRRAGVIALKELSDSNALLASQTDFSRAGLERLRREQQIEEQVLRDLAGASEKVRERYREQLRIQYDLIDQARIKADLLERFAPFEADQADRQRALNELYRAGALSLQAYTAAQAELAIERGEGTFEDGFAAEYERMLQESSQLTSDLGSSFASVFGPDGVIQRGLADSAAASLVLGESFRESFGRIARQAVASLVSEMIRVTILAPIMRRLAGSLGGGEQKAAQAAVEQVTAQAAATAAQAGANAYAATAAIPVVGPGLAPAAALTALKAASIYGAVAIAAQAAAAGAAQSKFQYGGIIDRRTEFGFGGGRRGVAGEAGPEAILPLARGPAGLGVRATGGGGRQVSVGDINLAVTIQAPEGTEDAEAFGRAAVQRIGRELRPVLRELLLDEQRPGGALNRSDQVSAF